MTPKWIIKEGRNKKGEKRWRGESARSKGVEVLFSILIYEGREQDALKAAAEQKGEKEETCAIFFST